MEAIDVTKIHDNILNFLLNWRKKNPGFRFILRKSDLSKRLSSGYWFHGNDDYIAISFWTGMDWQSKVPNISFVIIPVTGECYLQFSAKDSVEKEELVKSLFKKEFDLNEISRAFYSAPIRFANPDDYLKALEKFLLVDKLIIDEILSKYRKSFDTKQNTKNRIGFIEEKDFEKDLKRTLKFQKAKYSSYLPIGLYEIEIENYGMIKNLVIDKIPADAQWIFFTGENGTGKTTILKALASALMNGKMVLSNRDNGVNTKYSIALTLQRNGSKSIRHRINSSGTKEAEILSKGFVAFGPVRLNVQDVSFSTAGKKKTSLDSFFASPYRQLFTTISPLIDIGYVYNRNAKLSKELKNDQEKLKYIIEAITSICDSIVDVQFGRGMRYLEVDQNGRPFNNGGTMFQNLASGYKSIIALVSHMMLHLYHQQPEIDDPSLLEGIVIIDEIDLHFHPKMQRDLVIKLSEIFPRIQFIASTHSPIPLLGVAANTPIFTTHVDASNGIYIERMNINGEISELLPNAILTSPIFNLQEILPKSQAATQLINTNDSFDDVVFYKMLDEKLEELNKKYLDD